MYYDVTSEAAADKLSNERRDMLLLKTAVLDDPVAIRKRLAALDGHAAKDAKRPSRATLKKPSDIHLQAEVSTPRAGVLLIAMPFDSGWAATVDGAPVELFRADYGLTAMLLPPGLHQIQLRYTVRGRSIGVSLSLAALIILLTIGTFQGWRAYRRTSGNSPDQAIDAEDSSLRSG
jgi:hypothetical protein